MILKRDYRSQQTPLKNTEFRLPCTFQFKYREIAEKLEPPLGTVKSRIFFTRLKI